MFTLYRPFSCIIESAHCLSPHDRARMKQCSATLARAVCQRMGWMDVDLPQSVLDDPYVKFYANDGRPMLDALLEYHYAVHMCWLNVSGETTELCREVEPIFRKNKNKCASDCWRDNEGWQTFHAMLLLRRNHAWYKRKFRNLYIYRLDDYSEWDGKTPRSLSENDLIKFMEPVHNFLEEEKEDVEEIAD